MASVKKVSCDAAKKALLKIAAFDFDHTLINANSDTYINRLVIEREKKNAASTKSNNNNNLDLVAATRFRFPPEIENLYETHSWPVRMNAAFAYMHEKFDVSQEDILACLKEVKIDESMKKLLKSLKEQDYDLVIISDANTVLIETILRENEIWHLFDAEKIFTNGGHFDAVGRLVVKPFNEIYFNEAKTTFDCPSQLCTPNMCKGLILRDYIRTKSADEQLSRHIIYAGDGHNDFCPGMQLDKDDYFLARKKLGLFKLMQKKELADKIKATVKFWENAEEILEQL